MTQRSQIYRALGGVLAISFAGLLITILIGPANNEDQYNYSLRSFPLTTVLFAAIVYQFSLNPSKYMISIRHLIGIMFVLLLAGTISGLYVVESATILQACVATLVLVAALAIYRDKHNAPILLGTLLGIMLIYSLSVWGFRSKTDPNGEGGAGGTLVFDRSFSSAAKATFDTPTFIAALGGYKCDASYEGSEYTVVRHEVSEHANCNKLAYSAGYLVSASIAGISTAIGYKLIDER